ncbi:MAG: imidazole glycerol phosphate synthase subunit HisH [Chloroflexi bacterium]|nr:imidazole glycerol phosphate synthase subunit HisH [Chloroflexota bacterium]
MIAIVDYGAGNLRSVAKAIERLGYTPLVTHSPKELLHSEAVIMPGVGTAAAAMERLHSLRMIEPIRQIVAEDRPFFGVCLGLQLLFSATEEGGDHKCLDLLEGRVRRLPLGLKVPHMGWNQLNQKMAHPLFDGIPQGTHFYFVHSYYADPADQSLVAGETDYGVSFASVVIKGRLVATQFHPEKSGAWGLRLYQNFLRMVGEGARWK